MYAQVLWNEFFDVKKFQLEIKILLDFFADSHSYKTCLNSRLHREQLAKKAKYSYIQEECRPGQGTLLSKYLFSSELLHFIPTIQFGIKK